MNRRSTLKSLVTASGALLTLPGWARSWNRMSLRDYVSSYTATQQAILSAVVDTIIPSGDEVGGLTVGVDTFLQKLFDRCYEKEVQDNVKAQLTSLDARAVSMYQSSYATCSQVQRETLLTNLSISAIKEENDFFKLIKSETIRGFNTSEVVMTKYLHYQLAPGHFYGSVDV